MLETVSDFRLLPPPLITASVEIMQALQRMEISFASHFRL